MCSCMLEALSEIWRSAVWCYAYTACAPLWSDLTQVLQVFSLRIKLLGWTTQNRRQYYKQSLDIKCAIADRNPLFQVRVDSSLWRRWICRDALLLVRCQCFFLTVLINFGRSLSSMKKLCCQDSLWRWPTLLNAVVCKCRSQQMLCPAFPWLSSFSWNIYF